MKKNKRIKEKRILSAKEIETELKKISYNQKYKKVLKSTVYALIIIIALSIIVATFMMPVFQISTSSMTPKLNEGDIAVSIKTKKINEGDIIAFYHGNKILIKRVIGTPGSYINIDENNNLSVNGKKIKDAYINEYLSKNTEFPYQIKENTYFVLSDNLQDMNDSRNAEIGCISDKDIIGKLKFKIWPIKDIGAIN